MLIIQERAVKSGQFSYPPQAEDKPFTNGGSFEPDALEELHKKGRLFVVADSVWGAAAGSVASEYATRKVIHDFYRIANHTTPEKRLVEVIQKSNQAIWAWNEQYPNRRPLATTLIALLLHQGQMIVSNVGDNQAFVIWEKSIEPVLPSNAVDGRSGLGLDKALDLETFSRRARAGESVVLCSGGLSGYISQAEMVEQVHQLSPADAARELARLAYERGCRDQLTINIIQILDQPVTQTPPNRSKLPTAPTWEALLNLPPKQLAPPPKPPKPEPPPTDVPLAPAMPRQWLLGSVAVALMIVCIGGVILLNQLYFTDEATDSADGLAQIISSPTPLEAGSFVLAPSPTPTAEPTRPTTPTPSPSPSPQATAISSPPPTATLTPTPAPTVILPPGCTNGARYYDDLTIPDGSQLSAGERFDKSWQMQNNGTCPWAPGYTLRFLGGDVMHEQDSFTVPLLQPNVITAVTIPLVAPTTAGDYTSNWQMHNLDGQPFGANLTVVIEVLPPPPGATATVEPTTAAPPTAETTLYDFVAQAESAVWLSTGVAAYQLQEATIDSDLVVPAPAGLVVRGEAMLRGRRATGQPALLTHPHQDTGLIEGSYALDTPLRPTDALVLSLGFPQVALLNDDGATFSVGFVSADGSAEQSLFSETVTYQDSPLNRRIPLDVVAAGQTGEFILRVESGASATFDWALWLEARLVRTTEG